MKKQSTHTSGWANRAIRIKEGNDYEQRRKEGKRGEDGERSWRETGCEPNWGAAALFVISYHGRRPRKHKGRAAHRHTIEEPFRAGLRFREFLRDPFVRRGYRTCTRAVRQYFPAKWKV